MPETVEKVWRPNSRPQEIFTSLPDSIDHALYGGEAGGGKTECLLMLPFITYFQGKPVYEYPWFKCIIFRRTFPQLERSLIPRSLTGGRFIKDGQEVLTPSYYDFGGKWNAQKHTWTFPSGAVVIFGHLDTDTQVAEYDTDQYNMMIWEELTDFTEKQYFYLSHRCRGPLHIIRAAATPGNIGNAWVRKYFIEPTCLPGNIVQDQKVIFDRISKTSRIFIRAGLKDNVDMIASDPEYNNRIELLPEADKRAKRGDWWAFEGQVFSEFRSNHFSDEPAHAIHVIDEFSIPDWWPKIVSIDWGYAHNVAVYWGAISPDNRLFIYREYVVRRKKISEWSSDIKRLSQADENIMLEVIDPSANKDDGLEKTIKQQFIESSGWENVEDADNDRIGGKMLLHEMLRWTDKPARYIPREGYDPEVAQRILRVSGLEMMKEYRDSFLPEAKETNLPKLQIFRSCSRLIETIPQCVYDETRPEDIKRFDGDDPIDSLRYLVKAYHRYIHDVEKENKRRSRLQSILDRRDTTGDMTGFYREMEKFQRDIPKVVSIRRKSKIARIALR